jgi:hypothetical protein
MTGGKTSTRPPSGTPRAWKPRQGDETIAPEDWPAFVAETTGRMMQVLEHIQQQITNDIIEQSKTEGRQNLTIEEDQVLTTSKLLILQMRSIHQSARQEMRAATGLSLPPAGLTDASGRPLKGTSHDA